MIYRKCAQHTGKISHLKYKWNNEKPFKIHTKSKILKTKLMKTGEKINL